MGRSVLGVISLLCITLAAAPSAAQYPVGGGKQAPPGEPIKIGPARPGDPNLDPPVEFKGRRLCADDLVRIAAEKYGLDPKLVKSVVIVESGGDPRAVSHKGAAGCMQLMPGTAADLGVRNRLDPWQNIAAGTQYLRDLLVRFNGDLVLALAGYNAGEGAVEQHGGVPPYAETRGFVRKVLALYKGREQPVRFEVAVARHNGDMPAARVSRQARNGDSRIAAAEARIEKINRAQRQRDRIARLERAMEQSVERAEDCRTKEAERVAYAGRRRVRYANRVASRPEGVDLHISRIRTYAETCALREEIAQVKIEKRLAEARRSAGLAAVPDAPAPAGGWVLSSEDREAGTAVYVRQEQ